MGGFEPYEADIAPGESQDPHLLNDNSPDPTAQTGIHISVIGLDVVIEVWLTNDQDMSGIPTGIVVTVTEGSPFIGIAAQLNFSIANSSLWVRNVGPGGGRYRIVLS